MSGPIDSEDDEPTVQRRLVIGTEMARPIVGRGLRSMSPLRSITGRSDDCSSSEEGLVSYLQRFWYGF